MTQNESSCISFIVHCWIFIIPVCVFSFILSTFFILFSPLYFYHPDVTLASVVQLVSLHPRLSQPSCQRVSPAPASPPTTAFLRFAGLKSALAAACLPAAKLWCLTGTAGDTWSLLHQTVPRPGNIRAETEWREMSKQSLEINYSLKSGSF